MKIQRAKGADDYYPEENSVKNKIFQIWRDTAKKFGFKEVETPVFEPLELLTKDSGDEIVSQLFTFEKRGSENLGLRYDGTAPCTRLFMQSQKELPKPIKWFYIEKMWRYERPQAGRMREFYQFGAEFFGSDKPGADAELISLLYNLLINMGLKPKDFKIKFNNRKLLQGILLSFVTKDKLIPALRLIDKKSKIDEKEFDKGLKELGIKDFKKLKEILEIKTIADLRALEKDGLAQEGFLEMKQIYDLVKDKVVIDLTIARGLGYYTSTVFEVFDKDEKFRALAGGGRYDNMVGKIGGIDTPATGFAMGLTTITLLLKDKNLLPKSDDGVDYFIMPIGDTFAEAMTIADKLRKNYSVDIDVTGKSLGKLFAYAEKVKAKNAIILGDDELKQGIIKIKNLKTGKEEQKNITEL